LVYWLSAKIAQEADMRPLTVVSCAAALFIPAAAAAATSSTAAAPSGVTQDARCLMIMGALTGSKDQNAAMEAQFGVAYFAGRIKARDPSFNFGARLPAVAAGMNGQPMQAEANRCGPMVVEALQQLDAAQKSFAPPPGATGQAKPPAAPPPTQTPPAH
jgi:hypothetical protein